MAPKTDVIEELRARNAELEKEVEALTNERDLNVRQCDANTQLISQLRQQLAIAEEHNARLREFLEKLSCLGNGDRHGNSIGNCIAIEALSIPASREALDKHVAEKVKELQTELETERLRLAGCGVAALGYFDGCCDEYHSASLDDTLRLYAKYEAATKQRDLAVSALEKVGELMLCGKKDHLPWRCSDASKLVLKTLAKIKESEST